MGCGVLTHRLMERGVPLSPTLLSLIICIFHQTLPDTPQTMPPKSLGPLEQVDGTQSGVLGISVDTQLVRSTKTPWSLKLAPMRQKAVLGTKYPTYEVCHHVWCDIELNWVGGQLWVSALQNCLLLLRRPAYTSCEVTEGLVLSGVTETRTSAVC